MGDSPIGRGPALEQVVLRGPIGAGIHPAVHPFGMRRIRPARRGPEDAQRGTALVTAIFVSFFLGLLGFAYLMLGEMEARTVERHVDRARCRQAALDVASFTLVWWNGRETPAAFLPASEEWTGTLEDWRREGWNGPFAEELTAARLSGSAGRPDLLLEEGTPFLVDLARTLGEELVIESLAVHAAAEVEGRRAGRAQVTCTVAARRGAHFGGRATVSATVVDAPSFAGPEVVASGGDLRLERGARIRWGLARADGDVHLPPVEDETFPASGLPRGTSGLVPQHFAPGGPIDWNPSTGFRECVLTELIGYTSGGERIPAGEKSPPALADPWMAVHAGERIVVGGRSDWAGRRAVRQPLPHDPRRGGPEEDASHLMQRLGPGADPSLDGTVQQLADGRLGAHGGQRRSFRRFVLAGEGPGGEGLWREGPTGPERTAAEWMQGSVEAPFQAVFSAHGRDPARLVTLNEGAGVVVVEARELILAATQGGRREAVNMPGEPFEDRGIDADGDGWPDPGTAGNGRWDCDCDGDGVPDDRPPRDLLFDFVHGDVEGGRLPDGDEDPSTLATAPHEPFLNLAWPADPGDLSVRVSYLGLEGHPRQPVEDLNGDGRFRLEEDRYTSSARDEVGARIERVLHFRGLVVNLAGDVLLGPGFRMHGAVRAEGDVKLQAGAELSFDEALAREGRPSGLGLPPAVVGAVSWTEGGRPPVAGPPLPPAEQPAAPSAELGPEPGRRRGDKRG